MIPEKTVTAWRLNMEIKLIKNFEVGMLNSLNENLIIHVVDDNRQLDKFNGKRIYLFNPKPMNGLRLHQKYLNFYVFNIL